MRNNEKKNKHMTLDDRIEIQECLAAREPNQVGFDVQIFPIPLSLPLEIPPVCPAGRAFVLEKICCVKTARTRGRMHF